MGTIRLITAPTGGAPLTTNDYDAQNQYIIPQLFTMDQKQLHLTEWDTLTVPDLKEDVYIQHGGALFQVQDSDYTILGSPSNGRVYIKIARSGDTLTATFVNSASGYSWDYIYNGFYHADGSQLLPYVLYLDTADYYKFDLNYSINRYDITSNIIMHLVGDIGDWNMDTTPILSNVTVDYMIFIVSLDGVTIRRDSDGQRSSLDFSTDPGFTPNEGSWIWTLNAITLLRLTGGAYDSALYDATSYNRGWISYTIQV